MRTLLSLMVLSALGVPVHAESREVVGYAGVLGEWEVTASVTEAEPGRAGEFSGPVTLSHVGLCTQDGPERKSGDIRLRVSASRLDATLSLAGIECTYSASLSDAYKGQMRCPGRAAQPLTLWLR